MVGFSHVPDWLISGCFDGLAKTECHSPNNIHPLVITYFCVLDYQMLCVGLNNSICANNSHLPILASYLEVLHYKVKIATIDRCEFNMFISFL